MNKALTKYLTAGELALVQSTKPANLAGLDEDELGELHLRVRRAGNKYRTLHRRQAAASVRARRSRGAVRGYNQGTAVKAEVFEEALARVSNALAKAARSSAKELKAERLALASRPASPKRARKAPGAKRGATRTRGKGAAASTRTPASTKRKASTQATGARRQAKRDAR